MILIIIFLSFVWAWYEVTSQYIGEAIPRINRYFRVIIPVLVGLATWNPLLGGVSLVSYLIIHDPLRNLIKDDPWFYSRRKTFKQFLQNEAGLYDVFNGRIVLMFLAFFFIVLISESL